MLVCVSYIYTRTLKERLKGKQQQQQQKINNIAIAIFFFSFAHIFQSGLPTSYFIIESQEISIARKKYIGRSRTD